MFKFILINDRFAKRNWKFVTKLEQKIEEMIKSGKSYLDIVIPSDDFQKRKSIEALLQENYHADFDLYQHVRPMFISLRNNENLKLPKVNLTSYLK